MSTAASGGVAPALSVEQLLSAVPGLSETGISIDVVNFRQMPGAALTFSDISALAAAIDERLPGVDGVVITQGTDTIEETAYLLDLLHTRPEPVVVTGAMRNATLAGADGPANLLASIIAAADPSMRGQGCLIVFNDEIHAARRVRKTHTAGVGTFQSPNGGPLGYLVENQPRLLNRVDHRTTVPANPADDSRVPIYTIALGDDDTLLRVMADHIDGLIVAGLGAGHVPARIVPALEELASTVPVVLASRTGAGSVLASTYGFPGSERDLLSRGLISAGFLDPIKARILLSTLLATGCDHPTLRTAIAAAGGYSDPNLWPWPIEATKDS